MAPPNYLARQTPLKLTPPGPSNDIIAAALHAAEAAPDHGRLRPWQFIRIEGEGLAQLGETMAEALSQREPEAAPELLEKERKKPTRTPLIIVVATELQFGRIPELEQIMAAAAAAQNLQLAFHDHGFGVQWKTGAAATDPLVKAALGIAPHDHIIGFMYVGTIAEAKPERALPNPKMWSWP
jgi:nitroreductase